MSNVIYECVSFFKQNKGYKRFIEALYKKYLSLGKVGGTVVISGVTSEESSALSGLLRKDYSNNSCITIKVSDFKTVLESTRFKGCSIEELLKAYFNEELVTNSQKKTDYLSKREEYFSHLLDKYRGTHAYKWLESTLLEQAFGYQTIVKRYNSASKQLKLELEFVCLAVNHLPVLE